MIDISTNVIECGDDGAIPPVMLPPDFTYALDRCNLSSEQILSCRVTNLDPRLRESLSSDISTDQIELCRRSTV